MGLHDGAADGQARVPRRGLSPDFAAVEFFKNAFFFAGRNAGAAVADFEDDGAPVTFLFERSDFERRAGRRVFGGVLEQIPQYLPEEHVVHKHHGEIFSQVG